VCAMQWAMGKVVHVLFLGSLVDEIYKNLSAKLRL
jgi:hypothetical protein